MKRVALTSAAFLCSLAFAPGAFAQASAAPPPAVARARMANPVRGTASIEVIQAQPKAVGKDIVTVIKVKNMSNGPIAGLRVDEYWYDRKLAQVTGDTKRVQSPIAPGEIIEVTTRSPIKPDLYKSQLMFTHANGKINAKGVKKFTEDKK